MPIARLSPFRPTTTDAEGVGCVTDARAPTATSKPLLWAAGAGLLYVAAMVVFAVSCTNQFTRLDNQLAIAISVACIAVVMTAALWRSARLRLVAQLGVGALAGMYFQPSSALLMSLFVLNIGALGAWRSERRLFVMVLVIVGFVLGLAITYGLLMQLVVPTSIHC